MADIAATGTDKRSVTLLSIFNTRSFRAIAGDNTSRVSKSQGFYSNLLTIAIAVDNVSRNNIRATSQQFLNKLLAHGTLVVLDFSKLLVTEHSQLEFKLLPNLQKA